MNSNNITIIFFSFFLFIIFALAIWSIYEEKRDEKRKLKIEKEVKEKLSHFDISKSYHKKEVNGNINFYMLNNETNTYKKVKEDELALFNKLKTIKVK